MNKANPGYPGFPEQIEPAPTSTVIDHGAEIAAAEARFKAGKKAPAESSKNYHTSKERRSRPGSMDQGSQALGAKK